MVNFRSVIFNSLDFTIYLSIVFALYWFVINHNCKLQNVLIVVVSYVFHGWLERRFLSLIIFRTLVNNSLGSRLKHAEKGSTVKILLWTSIIINMGFLSFRKGYNFFLDSFAVAFSFLALEIQTNTLNIILPAGTSFLHFKHSSYTIEVYKKKLEPTEDLISFSAFVGFFWQLVVRPIDLATNFLPPLSNNRSWRVYETQVINSF